MLLQGGVEQLIDDPGLNQLLAVETDRRRVRDRILQTQPQEAHERQPVAELVLELFVREVVELHNTIALNITTASHGLRPALDLCDSAGRRHRASSLGRNASHGTIAFSFTSGSAFASSPA